MVSKSRQPGFTLIEVIVALAIVATTMYGGFFLLNRSVVNAQTLQDRVLAHWVAMNAYAEAELAGGDSASGAVEDQLVTLYGVDFLLSVAEDDEDITTESGSERTVSTLTIEVARASKPDVVIEGIVTRRGFL